MCVDSNVDGCAQKFVQEVFRPDLPRTMEDYFLWGGKRQKHTPQQLLQAYTEENLRRLAAGDHRHDGPRPQGGGEGGRMLRIVQIHEGNCGECGQASGYSHPHVSRRVGAKRRPSRHDLTSRSTSTLWSKRHASPWPWTPPAPSTVCTFSPTFPRAAPATCCSRQGEPGMLK